ncbi:MAG: DoxX family protein [Pseudooceanicola atlanticus]
MTQLLTYAAPLGRVLLSIMFITSGLQKITGYAGTQGYMEMMGVPGFLLPIVIIVEVVGGIALLIDVQDAVGVAHQVEKLSHEIEDKL